MTALFAARRALITQVKAALPLLDNVGDVFGSPQASWPTDIDTIWIGIDDPLANSIVVAIDNGVQEWLNLGAFKKKETFTIRCSYVAWAGDQDFDACCIRAETNLELVETQLRPNPTGGPTAPDGQLGTNGTPGPLAPTGWCGMSIYTLQMIAHESGPAVHVLFGVDCTTRI